MEDKDITLISFEDNGTEYIMEFDRDTVAQTEKLYDLSISDVVEGKIVAMRALFFGSFLKHHPNMKESTKEKFYLKLGNKSELFTHLASMYSTCFVSLMEDPEEGEALTWTAM